MAAPSPFRSRGTQGYSTPPPSSAAIGRLPEAATASTGQKLTKTSAPKACCAERPLRVVARAVEDSRLPPCRQRRATRVGHPATRPIAEKWVDKVRMDANILSYIHPEDSMRRLFFTVVAVSLLLVCSTESSYSVAPDAKSTGTAIGTAINSAVTTAFPGIMSIVNAIWPNKASDKKTKTDATNSPSVQDLQKNAVQGLQDLKKISSDLDVVTLFISNTVAAENSVIAM